MKKIFKVYPTYHINSAPHQDNEIHTYLIAELTRIARETSNNNEGFNSYQGKPVNIIIEIL